VIEQRRLEQKLLLREKRKKQTYRLLENQNNAIRMRNRRARDRDFFRMLAINVDPYHDWTLCLTKRRSWYLQNRKTLQRKHHDYYIRNREKHREWYRRYRTANLEHIKAQQKEYFQKHRDEYLLKCRQYYHKNKQWLRWQAHHYYVKHKEQWRANSRAWKAAHRELVRAKQRAYEQSPLNKFRRQRNDLRRRLSLQIVKTLGFVPPGKYHEQLVAAVHIIKQLGINLKEHELFKI
jgi:hypothetical protein